MPRHDPTPRQQKERTERAWARYKRLMRWMALAAIAMAGLALAYLRATYGPMPIMMIVATAAGVGLSVLLGTALMGLLYFSNHSGHDEEAALWDDVYDR